MIPGIIIFGGTIREKRYIITTFHSGIKPSKFTTAELSIGVVVTMAVIIVLICCGAIIKCRPNMRREVKHRNPAQIERQTTQFYSMGENPQLQWM